MAAERPLFGVGPDNFRHLYGNYTNATNWDDTVHANSLYLETLATTGILGALAFGWLAWALFKAASADVGRRGGTGVAAAIWQLAGAASLAAWFAHGIFDYFLAFTPTALAFWLIVGLTLRPTAAGPDERR
jgi:O-antigen ligase